MASDLEDSYQYFRDQLSATQGKTSAFPIFVKVLEESGYDQELDIYDREFMEGIEHEREINPTVIAQEELLEGKLKYKYIKEDEIKLDEEPSE